MKLSNKHLFAGKPKGFTLVELLVVIAIISTLGAISYGPIMRMLNNAEITKSNKVCKDLTAAVDDVNTRKISYFNGDQAKGGKDGLVTDASGNPLSLLDKWGNHYSVLIDFDRDNKISISGLVSTETDATVYDADRIGSSSIALSPGRDGLFDDSQDSTSF